MLAVSRLPNPPNPMFWLEHLLSAIITLNAPPSTSTQSQLEAVFGKHACNSSALPADLPYTNYTLQHIVHVLQRQNSSCRS